MHDDVVGKVLPAQRLDVVDMLKTGNSRRSTDSSLIDGTFLPGKIRAGYSKLCLLFSGNKSDICIQHGSRLGITD